MKWRRYVLANLSVEIEMSFEEFERRAEPNLRGWRFRGAFSARKPISEFWMHGEWGEH